ncbi:MAG TPA: hypothetical protein EYQ73_06135 [Candidatus Poseidoniales archaeon]|nr:hypothetical protein [Candidatus Poseidoniales archaeon]HIL64905.1 hypothetical protein [Candidatus Poseidoniales archaeon]
MHLNPVIPYLTYGQEEIIIEADGLRIIGGPTGLTIERVSALEVERGHWPVVHLGKISTSSDGEGFSISMWMNGEAHEIIRALKEMVILECAEALAAAIGIQLEEHTGRVVESDEHGLNILDQLRLFPNRWPLRKDDITTFVRFSKVGKIVQFQLPSKADTKWTVICIVSLIVALTAGIPFIQQIGILSADWMTAATLFVPFAIVFIGWYIAATKFSVLESRHDVHFDERMIHLGPHLLWFIKLPSRSFMMADFKDLDNTEDGLVFMFGNQRISCRMDPLEAEWILTEIVHNLREFAQSTAPDILL